MQDFLSEGSGTLIYILAPSPCRLALIQVKRLVEYAVLTLKFKNTSFFLGAYHCLVLFLLPFKKLLGENDTTLLF
jgi:hypothetical protein